MPVRTDAIDAASSALSTGLNASNTAAGAYNSSGSLNQTSLALGLAQTFHSGVDVSTKGLQSNSVAFGRAIPFAGGLLGAWSLSEISWSGPLSTADQAGAVNGGAAIVGAFVYAAGAPVTVTLAGGVAVISSGVQLAVQVKANLAQAAASAKTTLVLLDGGAGDDQPNTIKTIAACGVLTRARGRFGLHEAANTAAFMVAA